MNRWLESINRPEGMRKALWVMGLCGLFLRMAFVVATQNIGGVGSMDGGTYHSIASHLLAGQGYSEDGVNPSLFVAPGYPFFLTAIYRLVGPHPLVVELLQALLGTLTALVVFGFGRDLFGRTAGFIAFVLVLFLPELVVLNTFLYTETLFITLFMLALWLAWRALDSPRWGVLALAGLAGGLATLTRGVTMFLPLLFWVALLFRHRLTATLRPALLYTLFFVLPIVPWTIRNYITFEAVVPIAVGTGDVLWTGNYLPLDGKYSYDKTMALMDSMTVGMNQVERDRRLTQEAVNNFKAQPLATLGLAAKKFVRFWFWVYEGTPTGTKRHGSSWIQVVLALCYYPLLLLAMIGIWLSRRQWRSLLLVHMLMAYYVALHVAMLVVPRYRFPLLPLLALFAALTLGMLLQRWLQPRPFQG